MAKETYYFSHDYNARNDRKIAALVKKHKGSGYGVFWVVCEMIHEEGGKIEFDEITFGAVAKDLNEEVDLVRLVINDCVSEFKLFIIEEGFILSGRASENLEKRQELSKSRANSGRLGAIARQNGTKERKGKEIKGVSFENNFAVFPNGDKQELGTTQLFRLKNNDIKPEEILKGVIT